MIESTWLISILTFDGLISAIDPAFWSNYAFLSIILEDFFFFIFEAFLVLMFKLESSAATCFCNYSKKSLEPVDLPDTLRVGSLLRGVFSDDECGSFKISGSSIYNNLVSFS